MIIYCAGPIKGDITFQNDYIALIKTVETLGHTALSELTGKFNTSFPLSDKQIYTRDLKWIDSSKLLIAEISGPSLGVGFEISYAVLVKKIPVLAVYHEQVINVSAMITGCSALNLQVKKYKNIEDLQKIMRNFIINFDVI
jgi:nucleoside 2-deoxyribosyltransferase